MSYRNCISGDFGGRRALPPWQSEYGAAALLKAVWWDLRLASLLMHFFLWLIVRQNVWRRAGLCPDLLERLTRNVA